MKKNFEILKVGKTYKNRLGEFIKIVKYKNRDYPFIDESGDTYQSDGSFFIMENALDLIELVSSVKKTEKTKKNKTLVDIELFEEIERLEGMNQFLTQALNAEKTKTIEYYSAVSDAIDMLEQDNRLLRLDVESNSILSKYLYYQIKDLNWFQKLIFGYGKYRNIITTYKLFREVGFGNTESKQSNTGVINQAKAYENGTGKGY
jgi:hypothetical protein